MGTDFGRLLKAVAKGKEGSKNLTRDEAAFAMGSILDGKEDDARVAAFLTAMRFKGTTDEELSGFLDGMRQRYRMPQVNPSNLIDTAGAYDGRKRTLHLSLSGTIIACAAGCRIVTHSGSDLPPKKGVTTGDVLEALGMKSKHHVDEALRMLEKTGFAFIHESAYLPEMERLRGIRNSLGFRSFINTCEMAANPFGAKIQLISVAHEHFMELVAKSAMAQGVERAIVITGVESSDEIPLERTEAVLLDNGEVRHLLLDPGEYELPYLKPETFGDAKRCATAVRAALSQEDKGMVNRALFDGGVKIFLGGIADSIGHGIKKALEVLQAGKAAEKLREVAQFNK